MKKTSKYSRFKARKYTAEQYIKDTKNVIKLIKKALKKNPNCVASQMVLKQEERELKKYSSSQAVA